MNRDVNMLFDLLIELLEAVEEAGADPGSQPMLLSPFPPWPTPTTSTCPTKKLKDLLRRRFTRAGLVEPAILDRIDEIALLIRRFGLAAFLERLELAVQEL